MAQLKDRYAAVLFELSVQSGALEAHLAQATHLLERIETDRLNEILENRHIPDETKRQLLEKLFADELSPELMGFLHMAVEKGHEPLILPTLVAYLDLGERRRGKALAYVVSAAPLSAGQQEALGTVLSKKLGKPTELLVRVDPSLIGGFYIHVDGRLVDQSLRTRLQKLKEALKGGGLNHYKA